MENKKLHGNTRVTDRDIMFINEQFTQIDQEIRQLQVEKSMILKKFNITKIHFQRRLNITKKKST